MARIDQHNKEPFPVPLPSFESMISTTMLLRAKLDYLSKITRSLINREQTRRGAMISIDGYCPKAVEFITSYLDYILGNNYMSNTFRGPATPVICSHCTQQLQRLEDQANVSWKLTIANVEKHLQKQQKHRCKPVALVPQYQLTLIDLLCLNFLNTQQNITPEDKWRQQADVWKGYARPDIIVYIDDLKNEDYFELVQVGTQNLIICGTERSSGFPIWPIRCRMVKVLKTILNETRF
ncbi:hypothetical protein BO86DRAFT_374591 [Aspergillus japonicus CBS 114.51]|uniref:Uncharacterized protein n=1 Tax=Aspergillus japonicus CBS 114.51 TaxID=1448312 RepID=A0A8T8XI31_ASPJA|nr:hypothetical protein BO86DRAFT_374591 [Aspergillus japonicus CBS 114.51]RAH87588.1 hypothetical protein BO86DRAFT_374591 [Aspergillus japonicus CBS 114.51]